MSLIGKRYSLLSEEYSQKIVSTTDKERAKEIVRTLVEKLIDHTKPLAPKQSGVKICFQEAIAHGIHRDSNDVSEWALTVMDRLMRYLTIVTKVNMDSRPRLVDAQTGKFYPVATFEDLQETLQLMAMASSMLRPYVAYWYNVVFQPAFKDLPDEPRKLTREGSPNGYKEQITIMQETEVGLTSKELAVKTMEIMKLPLSVDSIRKQYLYPLANMGIINMVRSVINKSENICSPVEDSIFSLFDVDNDLRLRIMDRTTHPERYPSKNVLEEELRSIVKDDAKWGGKNDNFSRYKIEDIDGTELTIEQLIDKYLSNPETCFIAK